ncbi:MAG: phage tail protein [Clostridium sp.]|nr:phage tail protein [Clostridium sp.]
MAENKVNFGLKNVHYAPITLTSQGEVQYGKPIRIPGAVELSLEPRGDMSEFYADDILYYSAGANQGYDGTLTIANIPEQFAIDCLGEKIDEDDNVLTESVIDKGSNFALMFEFDGDIKSRRHVLYNCAASRPTVSSSTKTSTTEPVTNELIFVSMAREDYKVKTKTIDGTPEHIYNAWFRKVYDGIKNTIDRQAPTYSKASQDLVLNIQSIKSDITVTGLTVDGVVVEQGLNTWEATGKTLTLKNDYLDGLANTGVDKANYQVLIQTNKGNDILVTMTVTD